MTAQEVLSAQRGVFYPALINRDWDALSKLYADDYTLVRSDGTVLDKVGVLADLKTGTLRFRSIELWNEQVRLVGLVGLLTGESRAVIERNSVDSESHFRFTAIYTEVAGALRLLHFESTDIVTPKALTVPNFSGFDAARSFVGAWSLASYTEQTAGLEAVHPFGTDAEGLLIYTEDGMVSAQVMRAHRGKVKGDPWDLAHAEDLADLAAGYIAYCGRYFINRNTQEVLHIPVVALIPNLIDQPQHRGFLLDGTTLVLQTMQDLPNRGTVETRLTWQRLLEPRAPRYETVQIATT